mmetsp:Transcript_17433/g.49213  ORF Transcript_17433/g.49213 Transcript_17433/m.49213 type:complete len:348 (-) Transcript_17433:213-1256(-)
MAILASKTRVILMSMAAMNQVKSKLKMRCTTKNLSSTLRQKRAEPYEYDTYANWQRRLSKWDEWMYQDEAKSVQPADDLQQYAKDIRRHLGFEHKDFFEFFEHFCGTQSQAAKQELQTLIGDIKNYNDNGATGGEIAQIQEGIQNLKTSIQRLESLPKDPTLIAQIIQDGQQQPQDNFYRVVADFDLADALETAIELLVEDGVAPNRACSGFLRAINKEIKSLTDKIDSLTELRNEKIDKLNKLYNEKMERFKDKIKDLNQKVSKSFSDIARSTSDIAIELFYRCAPSNSTQSSVSQMGPMSRLQRNNNDNQDRKKSKTKKNRIRNEGTDAPCQLRRSPRNKCPKTS